MPAQETLERFIRAVESNDHAQAIADFYTEDCSLQENQAEPRRGRDAAVARERQILSRAREVHSECVRPVFVAEDFVVIRWRFRFVWLDGKVTEMEELAYQQWEGERIAREQFFYDPAQREPK
ncbi:MAG TPA: nuclear transport factor 2 family protein [Bryobacteraceae bacterium]|jgi:hypothetical protein|nr:nuclear transport factor 2 family protein [Bryobacteraceae bacterium]